jgi:hypothetical protein
MEFRRIFFDGCNGMRLGELVDAEPDEKGRIEVDELEFFSRNDDGLYEDTDDGQTYLVPVG